MTFDGMGDAGRGIRRLGRNVWLLALIGVLGLAACSSDDEVYRPCPRIVVVKDAQNQVRFVGPGRDLTDVAFEARIDGDHIRTRGELRREGRSSGFAFRAEMLMPCLGLVEFGRFRIAISATPIDDEHTWLWFRYHSSGPLARLGRLASWFAVQTELRVVQRQDWRIFRAMVPGTIDDVSTQGLDLGNPDVTKLPRAHPVRDGRLRPVLP